jgi:hypothetical protein
VGSKGVSTRSEVVAQLNVIVNLPIEDERRSAVVGEHRLVPALDIDDAETTHPEARLTLLPLVAVVRTSMLNGREHASHVISVIARSDDPANPTHVLLLS